MRARMTQADVGRRAHVSQETVSAIENGRGASLSLRTLRSVASALGADAGMELRWRGGDVDRLLDRRHAAIVSLTVETLTRHGWRVATEVTYARFGERGAYDVLALHEATGVVLAVEAKTRLLSLEATLRKLDEKTRLAPTVARDRFGMSPAVVARMLVLPEGAVSRRSVARHDVVLSGALPLRGHSVRRWLVDPGSPAGLLMFVKEPAGTGPIVRVRRVSTPAVSGTAAPRGRATATLDEPPGDRLDPAVVDPRRQRRA